MKDRQHEQEQDHQQDHQQNHQQETPGTADIEGGSPAEGPACEPAVDETEPTAAESGDGSGLLQAEPELEQLKQQWEQERAELVSRLLRLKADFDNYKRRNEAQIEMIRATANQNLLTGLLPVIDNFERAIAAGEEDSPYLAGVRMIFNQLMECLQKEGLAPVDAVGKPFDPTVHEAVSMEGGPGEDLIVIEELQKGYYYKDKLLRASMVKVAPKQQHEEE